MFPHVNNCWSHHFPSLHTRLLYSLPGLVWPLLGVCVFYPVMKVSIFTGKSNERGTAAASRLCWWGLAQAAIFLVKVPLPPSFTSQLWLTSPAMAPDVMMAHPEARQGLWLGKAKWARVITFFTQNVGIRKLSACCQLAGKKTEEVIKSLSIAATQRPVELSCGVGRTPWERGLDPVHQKRQRQDTKWPCKVEREALSSWCHS